MFPEDLYEGSKNERTLIASGQFLKKIYDLFLIHWSSKLGLKLEKPIV